MVEVDDINGVGVGDVYDGDGDVYGDDGDRGVRASKPGLQPTFP